MRKRKFWKQVIASLMALAMAFSLIPTGASAVSDDQVAADGTYTSSIKVSEAYEDAEDCMEEDEWDDYTITVKLTVSDGLLSAIEVTSDEETGQSDTYLGFAVSGNTSKRNGVQNLVGSAATVETFENWDGNPKTDDIDGVSGATCSYEAIKAAAIAALADAPEATTDDTDDTSDDTDDTTDDTDDTTDGTDDTTDGTDDTTDGTDDTTDDTDDTTDDTDDTTGGTDDTTGGTDDTTDGTDDTTGGTDDTTDDTSTEAGAVTVAILGVTYLYSAAAADGYTEIGDTGIYYAVADGEEALSGTLYGTADLEYADYYAGDVTEGYEYDAITTATVGDYDMFTYMYDDYDGTQEDGYNILGVTDVNVAVDAEFYVEAVILSEAGGELTEAQEAAVAITMNDDPTEAVSQYKTLDEDGYGATVMNVVDTIDDAEPTLSTSTTWGEYEIDLVESSTSYLRNTRSDEGFAVGSNVTGIILTAVDEEGNEVSVGLAYLANIWIQPYKMSFNVTDTTATKNIAYSGDTAKYAALVGKTITTITYLTDDETYVYEVSVFVKDVYSETVTGSFDDELTEFTLDSVPEELTNPVLTVEYTVGSGRTATSYTLYSDTATTDTVTLDLSEIEGLEDGTYSATISSDNYADIDVAVAILDSQVEELEELIATAETLLATVAADDSTLASHQAEAEELIASEDATMSAADELIEELEELIAAYPTVIEIAGVYYLYTTEETDGYTEIGESGIYYAAYSEALSGNLYGTADLTYAEFYAGDVTEDYEYDAITTATTGDYDMFTYMYDDYDEETSEDGYNILGVTDVNIAVDAEFYVEAVLLDAAGEELTDAQEKAVAITLNDDPTEAVSQYKTLDEDGYGATVMNVVDTIDDANPTLSTSTTWGEYEIDLVESSTSYLRNTRSDEGFAVGSNVTGIILTAVDEEGNEVSVGLAYLANIWIQPYKMSFNVTDTTATKNIAYSGDTAKYAALVGKTITTITYLTNDEAYVYEVSVYVKDVYDGTVTGSFDDELTEFTLDEVPEELENPVLTVTYTVGSGKTATTYTLYEGTATTDTVTLDTSVIEGLEDGTYSATVSSDNYADIDVAVLMLDSQAEELETLVSAAEILLSTAAADDSTLASHQAEAEELLADEETTMSAADELIEELTELIEAYDVTILTIGDVVYLYTTAELTGFTALDDTGYYYAVGDDALTGTIYGTASLTYDEYYSGDVTEDYTYDAITTATTGDYEMFDNMYTDYDEETSEDGYNILGVSNVNIAVDADLYVTAAILNDAGEELTDAQAEAVEITLNEDYTTAPSQYKTLQEDGTYSATTFNVAATVTDATYVFSTNSTWGEYEIDVYETSTSYLRNTRSNTYTDDDGNTQTFAVGSNITGIILTAVDEDGNEISVGLAYLANIWIQPYKLSFNAYDTSATKNIAYSGDAEKYAALVGTTITSITYLTNDAAYVYTFEDGIYVKEVYDGTVTGSFDDDLTEFTLDEVPEELENPVLTVTYTVGSGKTATTYTLYEGTATTDTVTLDLSVIEGLEDGTYSATISSDNYADIDVAIPMTDAQRETLEDLIDQATELLAGDAADDTTLASHVEEAEELLADEDATMSEAAELIEELEELIAAYAATEETTTEASTEETTTEASTEETTTEASTEETTGEITFEGSSSTVTSGSALTFTVTGSYSALTVTINGKTVDSSYLTITTGTDGNTVVTVSAEYMSTLSEGSYTLAVSTTDGTTLDTETVTVAASTTTTAAEETTTTAASTTTTASSTTTTTTTASSSSDSTETGDSSNSMLYAALFVFALGAALICGGIVLKKREDEA